MSFLPQFVSVKGQESAAMQFVFLGLVFAFFGFVFLATLGYFSGWIGQYLKGENNMIAKRLQSISGFILIVLGIRLALIKNN
jgi:threonine/homoserine/homoserine lactone efflux protein